MVCRSTPRRQPHRDQAAVPLPPWPVAPPEEPPAALKDSAQHHRPGALRCVGFGLAQAGFTRAPRPPPQRRPAPGRSWTEDAARASCETSPGDVSGCAEDPARTSAAAAGHRVSAADTSAGGDVADASDCSPSCQSSGLLHTAPCPICSASGATPRQGQGVCGSAAVRTAACTVSSVVPQRSLGTLTAGGDARDLDDAEVPRLHSAQPARSSRLRSPRSWTRWTAPRAPFWCARCDAPR